MKRALTIITLVLISVGLIGCGEKKPKYPPIKTSLKGQHWSADGEPLTIKFTSDTEFEVYYDAAHAGFAPFTGSKGTYQLERNVLILRGPLGRKVDDAGKPIGPDTPEIYTERAKIDATRWTLTFEREGFLFGWGDGKKGAIFRLTPGLRETAWQTKLSSSSVRGFKLVADPNKKDTEPINIYSGKFKMYDNDPTTWFAPYRHAEGWYSTRGNKITFMRKLTDAGEIEANAGKEYWSEVATFYPETRMIKFETHGFPRVDERTKGSESFYLVRPIR
ncbi:MAG: hypothetical protein Q4A64_07515 [Porphyromonadaceae bacterium]|nr:hypothetical protein [Porphyromonadaceae bacterium]